MLARRQHSRPRESRLSSPFWWPPIYEVDGLALLCATKLKASMASGPKLRVGFVSANLFFIFYSMQERVVGFLCSLRLYEIVFPDVGKMSAHTPASEEKVLRIDCCCGFRASRPSLLHRSFLCVCLAQPDVFLMQST